MIPGWDNQAISDPNSANTLRKSNVILWLYFGNLSQCQCHVSLITLEIPTLQLRWFSLRKFCYVNMRNINVNKFVAVSA